tara:strand:+ start:188 stop:421 length:234 start_codon:yes stop_codon:yes gene_type:complete
MKQAEYKGEIYSIETVYVYDEYISMYKGNLLETESIKVPLSEVKILPMHYVSKCDACNGTGIVEGEHFDDLQPCRNC